VPLVEEAHLYTSGSSWRTIGTLFEALKTCDVFQTSRFPRQVVRIVIFGDRNVSTFQAEVVCRPGSGRPAEQQQNNTMKQGPSQENWSLGSILTVLSPKS